MVSAKRGNPPLTSSYSPNLASGTIIINIVGISMIEVSNVDFTDTDVDSLTKPTNLSCTIFFGIN